MSLTAGHQVYAANNIWNHGALPSSSQVLIATDPGNWHVTANMASGNTAVISAPQVRVDFSGAPAPLPATLYTSFADDMHAHAGTAAQFGYDVWTGTSASDPFAQEMMLWTDTVNRGTCGGATPVVSGVQFGGQHGVPVQTWNLCVNGPLQPGSEFIWYLPAPENEQAGSVDIRQMLQYMTDHGYYPATTGISQVDETFEICSTGGTPETFAAPAFSLTGS